MSLPRGGRQGKYEERPAPCPACGAAAWWNGKRMVSAVVGGIRDLAKYVTDRVRRRARCSDRSCEAGSWTEYGDGDYPHRTFQLDVVSSAVVQSAREGCAAAARAHLCSRRTVGRWVCWCVGLASAEDLVKLVVRLDANGLPPPRPEGASLLERASWVVGLWERLGQVLEERGVSLSAGRCGLQRVLCWQRERHGAVAWLTKESSPRLHVELSGAGHVDSILCCPRLRTRPSPSLPSGTA